MTNENQQPFLQDAQIGIPLEEYVRRVHLEGRRAMLAEYGKLERIDFLGAVVAEYGKSKTRPGVVGVEACPTGDKNPELNRYKDIRCFESTRVKLHPPNDYIHANYVDGFRHPKKFICTQGPKENTIDDFWRMVWQEKTVLIIALTKVGGLRCELYFPAQVGITVHAGDIKIQNQRIHHIRNIYDQCIFQISKGGQKRTVIHLLYHAWPDQGTPDPSKEFLNFMEHFRDLQTRFTNKHQGRDESFGPPIVVHCSAGVGRTGTLCALDVIMDRMMKTKKMGGVPLVSIEDTVKIMRRQRHNAVQSEEQYIFLHTAVLEYSLKHDLIPPEKIDITRFLEIK